MADDKTALEAIQLAWVAMSSQDAQAVLMAYARLTGVLDWSGRLSPRVVAAVKHCIATTTTYLAS